MSQRPNFMSFHVVQSRCHVTRAPRELKCMWNLGHGCVPTISRVEDGPGQLQLGDMQGDLQAEQKYIVLSK